MELSGVLPVDKPAGMTSHDVVDAVRELTGTRGIGHTGSLDPDATGLLILCLGQARRIVRYLEPLDKEYTSTFRLGVATNTDDISGVVVEEKPPPPMTVEEVDRACNPFRGEILQRPPLFSAVKVNGKRSYKLAREGDPAELPRRTVTVERFEVVLWEPPLLTVRIVCSKGTYIRSLARDLGESIGCGGCVESLRRVRVGYFRVENAAPLRKLTRESLAEAVLPVEAALGVLEAVRIGEDNGKKFQNGLAVVVPKPVTGFARIFIEDRFIGVGEGEGNLIRPRTILEQRSERAGAGHE